ncbi:hypothetical protein QE397_000045 [Rhodococcus sp. SORGH_AS 301]|nr:hypothetical protein [Rhodococcus sp. SORGH_AS_0301]
MGFGTDTALVVDIFYDGAEVRDWIEGTSLPVGTLTSISVS